jgi:hypothetical protein
VGARRAKRLGGRALALAGLAAMIAIPALPPHGPVLMRVLSPAPGAEIGLGGFELLVRFAPDRALAHSFRARLNGADVTDLLTTGENGSFGRLVGLLPGENVLRLEISGRVPLAASRLFEQVRELRVRMRVPIELDRG